MTDHTSAPGVGAPTEAAEAPVVWCWRSSHMVERCPSCDGPLMGPMCCFAWSEWRCFGCGAHLDSRVVTPKTHHEADDAPCIHPIREGETFGSPPPESDDRAAQ